MSMTMYMSHTETSQIARPRAGVPVLSCVLTWKRYVFEDVVEDVQYQVVVQDQEQVEVPV